MAKTRSALRKAFVARAPAPPLDLAHLLREAHVDETHCALHLVLVRCSASTLLRLRLVWPNVDGALHLALRERRDRLGLSPAIEGAAYPPLALYLQDELDLLLRRVPSEAWKDQPGFVLFRLDATDAAPLNERLVVDAHRRQSAWLDEAVGINYEERRSLNDIEAWGEAQPLGLRRHKTLWNGDDDASYYTFTQHLALHPTLGRACKALPDPLPHDAWVLRLWLDAHGSGSEGFRRDATLGDDLAVLLARVRVAPSGAWTYASPDAAPYTHLGTAALCDATLEFTVRSAPAPAWQRRPREELLHSRLRMLKLDRRTVRDPLTQRLSTVLRHTALGDARGAFFAVTLCFCDAVEHTAHRLDRLPPAW